MLLNKMKIGLLYMILGCFLFGCASDKNMKEDFSDGLSKIMVDEKTGSRYVVEHTVGDHYSVKLIERHH